MYHQQKFEDVSKDAELLTNVWIFKNWNFLNGTKKMSAAQLNISWN